jgi:hypothetical protein
METNMKAYTMEDKTAVEDAAHTAAMDKFLRSTRAEVHKAIGAKPQSSDDYLTAVQKHQLRVKTAVKEALEQDLHRGPSPGSIEEALRALPFTKQLLDKLLAGDTV